MGLNDKAEKRADAIETVAQGLVAQAAQFVVLERVPFLTAEVRDAIRDAFNTKTRAPAGFDAALDYLTREQVTAAFQQAERKLQERTDNE